MNNRGGATAAPGRMERVLAVAENIVVGAFSQRRAACIGTSTKLSEARGGAGARMLGAAERSFGTQPAHRRGHGRAARSARRVGAARARLEYPARRPAVER